MVVSGRGGKGGMGVAWKGQLLQQDCVKAIKSALLQKSLDAM